LMTLWHLTAPTCSGVSGKYHSPFSSAAAVMISCRSVFAGHRKNFMDTCHPLHSDTFKGVAAVHAETACAGANATFQLLLRSHAVYLYMMTATGSANINVPQPACALLTPTWRMRLLSASCCSVRFITVCRISTSPRSLGSATLQHWETPHAMMCLMSASYLQNGARSQAVQVCDAFQILVTLLGYQAVRAQCLVVL
jgi:hypothetical protein